MRFVVQALLIPASVATLAAQDLPVQAAAVLKKNCLTCHGAALQMSKLDLRTEQSLRSGGERGRAVVPGRPEASLLFRFAAALEQPSMPPGKKLPDADLAVLRNWIAAGAKLPALDQAADEAAKKAALAKLEERPILPEERRFWSFQPIRRPDAASLDDLWLAALRTKNLKPNPPASRATLIRRAYLDLWGLPPRPEEVQAFLADRSPDAFARLIDRLLDSPHYGERWARHWLDLARYSDSAGYEFDRDRPSAHLFRDWTIRAFQQDLPYDEFIRLQIAGDEIYPGHRDAIIATSFLRLGPEANIKTEQTRADELDDVLATTGGTVLGMTIGCARCHNHKFDPIPQKDYYRMQAVFFNAKAEDVPIVSPEELDRYREAKKAWDLQWKSLLTEKAAIEQKTKDRLLAAKRDKLPDYLKAALDTPADRRTDGQKLNVKQIEATLRVSDEEIEAAIDSDGRRRFDEIRARLKAHESARPAIETAMSVVEKKFEPAHFLHHGSVDSKGSEVRPGILSVAHDGEWPFPEAQGRRRAFAEWLTSPANPLTARVMVNRIWQHHFGEGIVRSPSNFGKTGEAPSHPELLDWLASEFIREKWSVKAMHRKIMLSRAYQMASDDQAAGLAADPENRLLWRQSRTRLESEVIRDSILAAAGTLDPKVGGPGVHPYIDPSLWAGSSGRKWPGKAVDDPSTWRRSIYIFQKRTIQFPMLELFDGPNGIGSCSRRNRSTIATQALILMNNAFVLDQAKRFAARVQQEAGPDPKRQIERAFWLALSRPPTAVELDQSLNFLKPGGDALVDFAQTLFNLNEFAYIP